MTPNARQRLVVIGSGWAGFFVAQHVSKGIYSTTVISPKRMSACTPLLASVACGMFSFSCAEEPIRAKGQDWGFVSANATGVDFDGKRVHCEAAFDDDGSLKTRTFDVTYDVLVICPGCESNTFGVPGVTEHAMFMRHVSDARSLRQKLFDHMEKASLPCASDAEVSALTHIAIVGGGPTGVEITAELYDLAKKELKDLYPSVALSLRITVFDVASHILGAYEKSLYEYATEHMLERGITIATNCVIQKVDDTHLHIEGRHPIPYGILLWVAGNKSVPFVDGLDVAKTRHGLLRILTDTRLRVRRNETSSDVCTDVYALGDAAEIEGCPLPTTAEMAVQKARYLVRHLNDRENGMQPFIPASKGLVTYIGNHDGISEASPANEIWSGERAWLSWRSGSFTWTRSWRNCFLIACALVTNAFFGRAVMRG